MRCHYCDTEQAIPTGSGSWMSVNQVVDDVRERGRPLALVTGGEPLAQRNCIELLRRLVGLDVEVQLETSGAYSVAEVPDGVRRVVDIKTPDSGESEKNRLDNLSLLREGDELKFVLCSRSDYEWARDFVRSSCASFGNIPLLFTVSWDDEIAAEELAAWVLEDCLPVRIQLQMHKVIWGAEASGV